MTTRTLRQADERTPLWVARLRRHVTWALVAKAGLIAILYSVFFSPSHRPAIDSSDVMQRVAPSHGSPDR